VNTPHDPKEKAGQTITPTVFLKLNLYTLYTYLCEMSCHKTIGRQWAAEQASKQKPNVDHSSLLARIKARHVWI
jgi:hypothetical protein